MSGCGWKRGSTPARCMMAERTPIGRKTYGDLHDELSRLGADLMARALGAMERGSIAEHAQPDEGATYAKKIDKAETHIDWAKPALEIDCLIRGLSSMPGAWTELNGERLKILNAEPANGSGAPGTALDDALTIACGEGALRLLRAQRAGKAAMNTTDLLRGFAVPRGSVFELHVDAALSPDSRIMTAARSSAGSGRTTVPRSRRLWKMRSSSCRTKRSPSPARAAPMRGCTRWVRLHISDLVKDFAAGKGARRAQPSCAAVAHRGARCGSAQLRRTFTRDFPQPRANISTASSAAARR